MPEKVVEKIIHICSKEGDVVLDCFSGSGTTVVVCKKNNRGYIGIEIDPKYYSISEERLNDSISTKEVINSHTGKPLDSTSSANPSVATSNVGVLDGGDREPHNIHTQNKELIDKD